MWWAWLGAGCASGVLVALSLPPFGWWPLAWVGFAVVTFILPHVPIWLRVLLGVGFGIGQYSIGLAWVNEFSIPGCIALVVMGALFLGAAFAIVAAGRRRFVAVGLPGAMVVADWARARFPFGGLPLGGASLGQAASPLAPSLRLGGGLLLTAETVLAGVVLAESIRLVQSWRAVGSPWTAGSAARREAYRSSLSCGLLVLSAVAIPLGGLLSPDGSGGHLPALSVALVQGGGPRGTRAIYTDPEIVFQRHLAASANLRPGIGLVIWPEGVLQSHADFTTTSDSAEVSRLAARLGSTVLVGVEQDVGFRHYLNEVVSWGPDGRIGSSYEKNHLVPFGEYVPDRSLVESLFNVADVPYDGIAGRSPGYLSTPAGGLGMMISYEVFFDERARGGVRAGGELLVVPTNTASYRSTQVPAQELAAARLRAWETGRWVVQVTPTGYTAVIDPSGQVTERSDLDKQEVVYAEVPRRAGRTVYVDLGDLPIALLALAGVVLGWIATRWPRRDRHHDQWSLNP